VGLGDVTAWKASGNCDEGLQDAVPRANSITWCMAKTTRLFTQI